MRQRHATRYPETSKVLAYLASQDFTHTGQLGYQKGLLYVWTKRYFYKIVFDGTEYTYNNFEPFFSDLVYFCEIRPTFDKTVLAAFAKYVDANYLSLYRLKFPGKMSYELKTGWGGTGDLNSVMDFDFGTILQVANSPHVEYQPVEVTFGPMPAAQLYGTIRVRARIGYDTRYASGVNAACYSTWSYVWGSPDEETKQVKKLIQWGTVYLSYSFNFAWRGLRSLIGLADSQGVLAIPGYTLTDANSALAFIDAHDTFSQETEIQKKLLEQRTKQEAAKIRADYEARLNSEKASLRNFAQQQLFAVRTNKDSVLRDMQLLIVSAQGAMRGR